MKTRLLFFMALCYIPFTSCEEEKDEAVNPSETNVQESNTYPSTAQEASLYLSNDASKTWDANAFNLSSIGIQDCRLDDQITFNSDGTYAYSNGSLKCGGDVTERNGSYELKFDDKQVIFDKGTPQEEFAEIISLSDKEIKVIGNWSVFQISATYTAD